MPNKPQSPADSPTTPSERENNHFLRVSNKLVFPSPEDDMFHAAYGIDLRTYLIGQGLAGVLANPDARSFDEDTLAVQAMMAADAVIERLRREGYE